MCVCDTCSRISVRMTAEVTQLTGFPRWRLLWQPPRQADDARLGGRIGNGVRISLLAGDARDVDDAAVASLTHPGEHRTRALEGSGEVYGDDGVPILVRQLP